VNYVHEGRFQIQLVQVNVLIAVIRPTQLIKGLLLSKIAPQMYAHLVTSHFLMELACNALLDSIPTTRSCLLATAVPQASSVIHLERLRVVLVLKEPT
jgi:hypothetical protein